MKSYATGLSGAVPVVAVVAPVVEYHGEQIIVLPTPCAWLVIHRWRGPSGQDGLTPTDGQLQAKGTTSHWFGCANFLIYLTN